jgi:hypothetical protein
MPAAKAKASRHAVTPQLRPQDKVSSTFAQSYGGQAARGVVRRAVRERRDD